MTKAKLLLSLDKFTQAYITCMLWSSTDNADENGGLPLDANYDAENFTFASLKEIVADCKDFQESNKDLLVAAYSVTATVGTLCSPIYNKERAGHDFWLTRNNHGTGFWDRGLGKIGDELSKAAKAYGSRDIIVHRKKLYL